MRIAIDEEWYWIQRIAERLEASSMTDGWAVAQTIASFAGTIGTLILAAFAAFVAWKSHALSVRLAEAEAARLAREERTGFATQYQDHLSVFRKNWITTVMGTTDSSGPAELTVKAMMRGEYDQGTGAGLLVARLDKLGRDAAGWPRDQKSADRVGAHAAALVTYAAHWGRTGEDHDVFDVDAWYEGRTGGQIQLLKN